MNAYKILPGGAPSKLSFNELCMDRLPETNNMSYWSGKKGYEIYSGQIFKKGIENSYKIKFYTEKQYITFMNNLIDTPNNWNREFTCMLSDLALGFSSMIYLLLKQPDNFIEINCLGESDCRFWKSCKTVIMCANFLQGAVGRFVENKMNEFLIDVGIGALKVKCCMSDVTPSLLGCCYVANCQNPMFLYDFGGTRIKRGFMMPNDKKLKELEPIYIPIHDFEESHLLHDRMIRTIVKDIDKYAQKEQKCIEVSICIANNIMNGEIHIRGRYGILKEFGEKYQMFFYKRLKTKIDKNIHVYMMNDAEAVARLYTQLAPEAVILTLGTAIGIGYPHGSERKKIDVKMGKSREYY